MRRVDDREFVKEQYASEQNLALRKTIYDSSEGPDAREVAFQAIAEVRPGRVLEVGGGEGELAERIVGELGAKLVGIDQSERMVEIQRSKGIDARVGTAEELPFADGEFDLAVAAWMLYHVPDPHRALAELARVLRPGGRLVAVANGYDHLGEPWDLMGRDRAYRREIFGRETGEVWLRRSFPHVERRDADGWVTLDEAAVRRYVSSWSDLGREQDVPPVPEPLRVRRVCSVFVAETAP
ncbi:MAG TPA: class I SAM-dependent methyltransferase [Gaiellaceae bacterium]|jgi:SAM-dependent methyltransferase